MWDWTPLSSKVADVSIPVSTRKAMIKSISLVYGVSARGLSQLLAGLPPSEAPSLQDAEGIAMYRAASFAASATPGGEALTSASAAGNVVSLGPSTLLRRALQPGEPEPPAPSETAFVQTPTAKQNLHGVAAAVACGRALLVEGPPGAGKTAAIEEVARATSNIGSLVRIFADDQLDSKVLLGSYTCTDVPGEFKWEPGALTRAVTQGRWCLIENIDAAPAEVMQVVLPLLETGRLFLPSQGASLQAAPGFHLIATRTVGTAGGMRQAGAMPLALWTRVVCEPLPASELGEVVQLRYRLPEPLVQVLCQIFAILKSGVPAGLHPEDSPSESFVSLAAPPITQAALNTMRRRLSVRDLFKWSKRLSLAVHVDQLNPAMLRTGSSGSEVVAKEAWDLFTCWVPKLSERRAAMEIVAGALGIPSERVKQMTQLEKPTVQVSTQAFTAGRAVLPIQPDAVPTAGAVYAPTGLALRLLERCACAISAGEPILLVGETGTGKTSGIQHIARQVGQDLVVQNLNQQSDAADFLGGFRPVELRWMYQQEKGEFVSVFCATNSRKANADFLSKVEACFEGGDWDGLTKLWRQALKLARKKMAAETGKALSFEIRGRWEAFGKTLDRLKQQREAVEGKGRFAFAFVEGPLVTALRTGQWILLDEINLASPETLQRISGLLEADSLVLTERGDAEPIPRHPDFRLFAAMNPPNDVGKKELPPGLRTRFTELYMDELHDREDILLVVLKHFEQCLPADRPPADDIAAFFLAARSEGTLVDGAGQRPLYGLRNLSRALIYVKTNAPVYGMRRALYDGFAMMFLGGLEAASRPKMSKLIETILLKSVKPEKRGVKSPGEEYADVEGYFIRKGPAEPEHPPHYVITPSIKSSLQNLGRCIMMHGLPVLIQGPTSAGKTSILEYLAKRSGHKFVRINNHEHTDLEEYIGGYVSDPVTGRLKFQEGPLVDALRKGHWVVLDELNLAPSDILEALNRLLDDNRELFIPETQTVVKPHPNFALFATQNPPGMYGGRKALSKAFTNRFLELNFEEIPASELEQMLSQRCGLPESRSKKVVAVMSELQQRRQSSKVFAGKHGFITPRDLFRWADRKPATYQSLAEEGYMLLGERLRQAGEKAVVAETIERIVSSTGKGGQGGAKVELVEDSLYGAPIPPEIQAQLATPEAEAMGIGTVAWTAGMKRLYTLVGRCLEYKEPCLLVGETGCGKTTICQIYAVLRKQLLRTVNCHQHTDTADFVGGLRPVRGKERLVKELRAELCEARAALRECGSLEGDQCMGEEELDGCSPDDISAMARETVELLEADGAGEESIARGSRLGKISSEMAQLFVWVDGPLVEAMRNGDMFLCDEISLADDAVLERINSVLDPSCTLSLAEKSGEEMEEVVGAEGFRMLATMNPGGDFGKKELSPALRNRFTEIWVPAISKGEELATIVRDRLKSADYGVLVQPIVHFWQWYNVHPAAGAPLTVRDVVTWVAFLNVCSANDPPMSPEEAYIHGASLVLLDGIGIGTGMPESAVAIQRQRCRGALREALIKAGLETVEEEEGRLEAARLDARFGASPFYIPCGPREASAPPFAMGAPTTLGNVHRVLRALQLPKPVMLEGSPGVGKTSLVTALAQASGHTVVRINLSEQTDMMDLLGSDLPVEGGDGASFRWCDGAFLQALKAGHWVLLDELNLASQSVLEGLNSCLDHRGAIFIPELAQEVVCPPTFRIFACQNPLQQGCGRKGLPKSFLSRFTKVYLDTLSGEDLSYIGNHLYPEIPAPMFNNMIAFNTRVAEEGALAGSKGFAGAPWDFNLRDLFRWCDLMRSTQQAGCWEPGAYADMVYCRRLRTEKDKARILTLFQEAFQAPAPPRLDYFSLSESHLQCGSCVLDRASTPDSRQQDDSLAPVPLPSLLPALEALCKAIEMQWMSLVVGPSASGKTSAVRLLARSLGHTLHEYAMDSTVDVAEFLGCFEQRDFSRHRRHLVSRLDALVTAALEQDLLESSKRSEPSSTGAMLLQSWTALQSAEKASGGEGLGDSRWFDKNALVILESVLTQVSNIGGLLKERADALRVEASLLGTKHATEGGRGFEWVDGMLIRALEDGHWVLVDNVNFCNASVLDRLNALLEPNGVLAVNECGLRDGEVRVVVPHKNFRLFLCMDPRHGEISRAMRNRGVEIFLPGPPVVSVDSTILLNRLGVPGTVIPLRMQELHLAASTLRGPDDEETPTLHTLLQWATLCMQQLQGGVAAEEALRESFSRVYVRPCRVVSRQHNLANLLEAWGSEGEPLTEASFASPTAMPALRVLPDPTEDRLWRDVAHAYHASRSQSLLAGPKVLAHLEGLPIVPSGLCAGANVEGPTAVPRLSIALKYVVDRSSGRDWRARLAAIQQLAALETQPEAKALIQDAAAELEELFGSDAAKGGLATASSLGETLELPAALMTAQPLELRSNQPLWIMCRERSSAVGSAAAFASLEDRLERVRLFRQWRRALRGEAAAQESASGLDSGQMSLLQQSYVTSIGKLDPELTRHPVVPHLSNLLGGFDEMMSFWLGTQQVVTQGGICALEKSLQERIALGESLAAEMELDKPRFLVHWRWLIKACTLAKQEGLALTPRFELAAEMVCGAVSYSHAPRKNWLWKLCGHAAMPRTMRHWETEALLLHLAKKLEPSFDTVREGLDRFPPCVVADPAIKGSLVDGLATLMCLRGDEPDAEGVLHAMVELSTQLDQKMEDLTQATLAGAPSVATGERPTLLASKPLWRLLDHHSLTEEASIVAQLAAVAAFPGRLPHAKASRLETFLAQGSSQSSRPPTDLAPYRKLYWLVTAGQPQGEEEAALLQRTLTGFLRRIWSASFNVGCNGGPHNKNKKEKGSPKKRKREDALDNPESSIEASGPPMLASGAAWLPYEDNVLGGFDTALGQKAERLDDLKLLARFFAESPGNSSAESEVCLLAHLLVVSVAAHRRTFDSSGTWIDLSEALFLGMQGVQATETSPEAAKNLRKAASLLESSSDPHFQSHAAATAVPALELLAGACEESSPCAAAAGASMRGELSVMLGLLQLHLLEPASVVDPCDKAALKQALLRSQVSLCEEALESRRELKRYNGDDGHQIQNLEGLLEAVKAQESELVLKICARPTPAAFEALCGEISKICGDLGSSERTLRTAKQCAEPNNAGGEEAVWQHSAAQVCHSLLRRYPMYRDLVEPLVTAIYLVKQGLRLLRHHAATSSLRDPQGVAMREAMVGLVQFPGSSGIRNASSGDGRWTRLGDIEAVVQACAECGGKLESSVASPFVLALLGKTAASCKTSGYMRLEGLRVMDQVSSVFVSAWGVAEDVRIAKQLEADQLYKYKGDNVTLHGEEAAEEERMLRALFPSYDAAFEDLKPEEEQGVDLNAKAKDMDLEAAKDKVAPIAVGLKPEDVRRIIHTMRELCASLHPVSKGETFPVAAEDRCHLLRIAHKAASGLAGSLHASGLLEHEAAAAMRGGHLAVAGLMHQEMTQKLQQNPSHAIPDSLPELAESYDIYVDSNVSEARLAQPVLAAFSDRIVELLKEWPENPILEQLLKIVSRILGFPLSTPILKITTGLELLLRKGYDWEAVAHKGVSIVSHLDTTRGLVARWRRMELDAWKQILATRERVATGRAQKWWFHLHELTRKADHPDTPKGGDEEEEEEEPLDEKAALQARATENFGLLDDFLHGSTLGDFEERMTLMAAFEREMELSVAVGYQRDAAQENTMERQQSLARLLYHVRRYYSVFSHQVAEKIRREKAPVEEKLEKFAALSRWDIGDYNHLISTTDKSHRTIGKCARDYDVVLNTRAAAELQVRESGWEVECDYDVVGERATAVALPLAAIPAWAKPHPSLPLGVQFPKTGDALMGGGLVQLTLRMRRFKEREVAPNGAMEAAKRLTTGVLTVREFLVERAACWRNEETKRSIKQKSLTDTLKLLSECGLSPLTTARDATQLDVAQLFAALPTAGSVATSNTAAAAQWSIADNVFYHCIARMVSFRHGAPSANKDVTRREVSKATGLSEHLLTLLIRARSGVASLVSDTEKLLWGADLLEAFGTPATSPSCLPPQAWLSEWLGRAKSLCDDAWETLEEAHLLTELAHGASAVRAPSEAVATATRELARCKSSLDLEVRKRGWLEEGNQSTYILAERSMATVQSAMATMAEAGRFIAEEIGKQPSNTVHRALLRILERIECESSSFEQELVTESQSKGPAPQPVIYDVAAKLDAVVAALLIAFQKLRKLAEKELPEKKAGEESTPKSEEPELLQRAKAGAAELVGGEVGGAMEVEEEEEEEEFEAPMVIEDLLTRSGQHMGEVSAALALPKLNAALGSLFESASSCSGYTELEWLQTMLCQLRGALMELADVANAAVAGAVGLQHEMSCLEHTMVSLFQQLFAKGFAKKQEEDTTGDGERGTEDVDGTGLGEGSGVKDISDELNNEEQIEGLKEENQDKKEDGDDKEESKPDEGVEMTNDFDGDMEDFKPPPEEEGKDEDEKEDEKEEVDRDMGDVGDEGDVVDQKAWDKEEDNEDLKDQNEKTQKDAPADGGDDEDVEIQAKENPEEEDGPSDNKEGKQETKPEKDGKDKPEENEGEEAEEGSDAEEGSEDGGDDNVNDAAEEGTEEKPGTEVREEDDFELPEEMDLDGMDEQEGDMDGEEGEDAEGDDLPPDEGKAGEEKDPEEPEGGEEGADNEINRAPEEDPAGEEEDKEAEEGTGGGEGEKMDEESEEEQEDPDPDGDEPITSAAPENSLENNPFGTDEDNKQKNDVVQGAEEAPDQSKGKRTEAASAQQQGQSADQNDEAPPGQSMDEHDDDAQNSGQGKQEANPMRSLGQVAKHWERRLNIQEKSGEPPPPREENQEPPGIEKQYEFMDEDDEGEEDTQVLAPATEDQAQEQAAPPSMPEDGEEAQQEEKKKEKSKPQHMEVDEENPEAKQRSGTGESSKVEKKPEDHEEEEEEEEESELVQPVDPNAEDAEPGENEYSGGLEVDDPEAAVAAKEIDVAAHRSEMERLMQAWRDGQQEAESADEAWRHLEALTGEYSRELCEMLRLVLEPTLATRLQGGYRTGKRIDMKKVIPYIASDFRKDRIWMRRTKPSKRQYQIMVAVDGSKSMQENGAGQLALEALVLISRALARLEVGEIGVVRFGEEVQLVHPFEQPFSDAAGARIIQKFDFVDENTDVLKFMAAAVPMLENARNSGSGGGAERVQIVFVISDAVFSNREACREWVSAAAAKNQLIVFIIIDNDKPGNSVLERKSFQFSEEGSMKKVAYMDSFPFPYYIVLRNISTMPQALGDALRQWFELLQKL